MRERTQSGDHLLVGAALSLSGRYGLQGRLAAAGVDQMVRDLADLGGMRLGERLVIPEAVIVDDESTSAGLRRALEEVGTADLLLGPYGSDLVAVAARWAAERGRVLFNHGGSTDDAQRLPGVVSIPSPASRYFAPVLEAIAEFVPGARVLLAAGPGAFGRHVGDGVRRAASRLGMTMVGTVAPQEIPEAPDVDVLISAGTFSEDVELIGRLRTRPVLASVAAGLSMSRAALGPLAEGVLGPSQWEEGVEFQIDVGPQQAEVVRSLRARVVGGLRPHLVGRTGGLPCGAGLRGGSGGRAMRGTGRRGRGRGALSSGSPASVHDVLRALRVGRRWPQNGPHDARRPVARGCEVRGMAPIVRASHGPRLSRRMSIIACRVDPYSQLIVLDGRS